MNDAVSATLTRIRPNEGSQLRSCSTRVAEVVVLEGVAMAFESRVGDNYSSHAQPSE